MLYKIDYSARGDGRETTGTKWVNFAANQTEAVKRFMGWFFTTNPNKRVRLIGLTEVEIIGDMSLVDVIDAEVGEQP